MTNGNKKRSKRRRTPYQNLGIELALTLGLPQVCPLWNGTEGHEDECCETKEPCLTCTLDKKTNIDYRLCDIFSQWFWREVQKMEFGLEPEPKSKEIEENG